LLVNTDLLITLEILLVVITPLLFLYLRGSWPLRDTIPCLLSIPVLWYLTYALLHELSHVAGTYLVGAKVVNYKLVPRFWLGEFGRAWIISDGITHSWQQLVSITAPYILDVLCIVAGTFVLGRNLSKNAFVIGLVFMLLFLRPAFDFVCEPIAFLSGDRGDFYTVQAIIGSNLTWVFIFLSLGLSLLSVMRILRRFVGFPEGSPIEAKGA
jgi:hypothetical protein